MNTVPVPHLTTALAGPLDQVERHLVDHQSDIESWFRKQWRKTPAPFYASVDLRNAGYKLAPVDTNLFPAGFNNLNPAFEALCIQAVQLAVERLPHQVDRILIIPENHTRNLFYLENLASLQQIIEKAGFEVKLGSLVSDLMEPMTITLESGKSVCLEPLQRNGNCVGVGKFIPELLVLNNDLSSGRPEILESLDQTVTPVLGLGWSNRLKSVHFKHYHEVAAEFCKHIEIDPWFIDPLFRNCGEIDFMQREGGSCLEKNVDALLKEIRVKYDEYEIDCQPYVVVKADSGTYGMGIMTVNSVDDIVELNRKQRSRMSTIKEGQKVTKVIIQEGVYTHETWGEEETVAEPVVYMIDHNVVGGFYRVHDTRAANENLNSPGMRFEPLAFDDCCISPEKNMDADAHPHPNRFYTYGVIARLALLAAARETDAQV
ncbi:MAG: glutamate--cysteine ligase [Proteobacteria bacterium]|nr:glutamate--cysteine ligase [Pseudomonadota bacterium]